jgi:hypothetical protein
MGSGFFSPRINADFLLGKISSFYKSLIRFKGVLSVLIYNIEM